MSYHLEAEAILSEIEKIMVEDPVAAARSSLGRMHLQNWGWLARNPYEMAGFPGGQVSDAKYCFDAEDVMLNYWEIASQLIAMEYLEGEPDLSPLTPDIFLNKEAQDERRAQPFDPFMSTYQPNVTLMATYPDGKTETLNLAGQVPTPKPEQGFREVSHNG